MRLALPSPERQAPILPHPALRPRVRGPAGEPEHEELAAESDEVPVAQRDRALDSLLVDGLVEQTADGRFALAGEGDQR